MRQDMKAELILAAKITLLQPADPIICMELLTDENICTAEVCTLKTIDQNIETEV